MKIYGSNLSWGGWEKNKKYPWYDLDFKDTQETLSLIMSNLTSNKNFSFIRFGDGPLGYIDDMRHRWHPKDEKIKYKLIEILSKVKNFDEEKFMVGIPMDTPEMSEGLVSPIPSIEQCWKVMKDHTDLHRRYYALNPIHYIFSCKTECAINFLKLIKTKKVCVVGNEKFPIEVLRYLFGKNVSHIHVPHVNAFYNYEDVKNKIINANTKEKFDVLLFAASFATYPIMTDLFEDYNEKLTMIDIGSIIDPFVNDFFKIKATPAGNVVTHSGKRGWWITDYPDIPKKFKSFLGEY